jgi:type I restriction enzyme S subunit
MAGANKAVIVDESLNNSLFSTGFMQWRPPVAPETLGPWLFYAVQAPDFLAQRDRLASGTTQVALNDGNLSKMTIPIAPLAEQHRIVEAIETRFARLDAAVRALERARANLKRYRASVLAAVFGNEDAPMLPLSALADVRLGKMVSQRSRDQGLMEMPYLRNENVQWGRIDYADVKTMGFREDELAKYSLNPGDVLVCEGGHAGRTAIFAGQAGKMLFQKALHRVRPITTRLRPVYLRYYMEYEVAARRVLPRLSETTIQHLTLEKMKRLPVPAPPIELQDRSISFIEDALSISEQVLSDVVKGLARAESLRRSILRCAFEGRLTPQNPNDEPASALLERIKAAHQSGSNPVRRGQKILTAE